jgi:hypothetical protein
MFLSGLPIQHPNGNNRGDIETCTGHQMMTMPREESRPEAK